MRTPVGRTVVRVVSAPRASALAGVVLRIEAGAVARSLSLLTGIVVLIKSWTAARAFAVIARRARASDDVRNEADAANEREKYTKAG